MVYDVQVVFFVRAREVVVVEPAVGERCGGCAFVVVVVVYDGWFVVDDFVDFFVGYVRVGVVDELQFDVDHGMFD